MYHVAIIIPFYKRTFFRETLDSLAAQTDQRFTVYIGNDASPENPDDLLEEFEGKFNFVYKKFERNLGGTSLITQWHRCIEMMQDEEWFMILGDDDYIDRNYVYAFNQAYQQNALLNYNVIKSFSKIVDEKNKIIIDKTEELNKLNCSAVDAFIAKATGLINSSLSEHFFYRKKYNEIKFRDFPLAWFADDFAILMFSGYGQIFLLKNAMCYVRMSSVNISGLLTNIGQKEQARIQFYQDVYAEMPINKFTQKQKSFFADFWFSIFPGRFNFKSLYLYYSSYGISGLVLYLKIFIYRIIH